MSGSPLVGGSKFVSWHPASIERMLKTDAGILCMLGKMLFSLPGQLGNKIRWATKCVAWEIASLRS
jgi:hypothetical protein